MTTKATNSMGLGGEITDDVLTEGQLRPVQGSTSPTAVDELLGEYAVIVEEHGPIDAAGWFGSMRDRGEITAATHDAVLEHLGQLALIDSHCAGIMRDARAGAPLARLVMAEAALDSVMDILAGIGVDGGKAILRGASTTNRAVDREMAILHQQARARGGMVVDSATLDMPHAARTEFAHLCDHDGRIVTVPVG